IDNTNGVVTDTRAELKPILTDIHALVTNLNEQVKPLSDSLQQTLAHTDVLLKTADTRLQLKPGEPLTNLNETLVDARKLVNNVNNGVVPVLAGADKVMKAALVTLGDADQALSSVSNAISRDSPLYFQINDTLREIKGAAGAIRTLANTLQRNPSAILTGK